MSTKVGTAPVSYSQKVGKNQGPTDPKKSFTVSWDIHTATVSQTVGISALANVTIGDQPQLKVKILFNNKPYADAEKVTVKADGQIKAQWKVVPFQAGNFTGGAYDVEISYVGFSGTTTKPLKIAAAGAGGRSNPNDLGVG